MGEATLWVNPTGYSTLHDCTIAIAPRISSRQRSSQFREILIYFELRYMFLYSQLLHPLIPFDIPGGMPPQLGPRMNSARPIGSLGPSFGPMRGPPPPGMPQISMGGRPQWPSNNASVSIFLIVV